MPNYRRDYSGLTWFFTVVTHGRKPLFLRDEARQCLSRSIAECRERFPFEVDASVLLPDHLHAVWTLPGSDPDYSRRWGLIKRRFTQLYREYGRHGPPYWQNRFWAHRIDDERDFQAHVDYVHINPMKHGLVECVRTWQWSTFHRYVARGIYPADWGGKVSISNGVGRE
jgi:putative transposase